ncbi:hypothetical protein DFJ74DRAFT_294009 [Hyaloraphidium curvatum]|nr:hypothetical protein DFJ74DRAFT_294009 [Hyaloraphidium curvatum]
MEDLEYVNEDGILDDLKCAICHRPFVDAVEDTCQPMPHSFCSTCIFGWIRTNRHGKDAPCPQSRQPLVESELKPVGLARRLTNQLIVHCTKRNEGCKWTGRRDNLADHLKTSCRFELVPCPGADLSLGPAVPGCTFSANRADLQRHVASCPFVAMGPVFTAVGKQLSFLSARCKRLQSRVADLEDQLKDEPRKRPRPGSQSGSSRDVLKLDGAREAEKKTVVHINAKLVGDPTQKDVVLSFALAKTTRLGKLMQSFVEKVHSFAGQPLTHLDFATAEYWYGLHKIDPDDTPEDLEMGMDSSVAVLVRPFE